MSTKRLTFEEVEKEFKKRGYILLENSYKNAVTKMRYKCPKHPDKDLIINVHSLKKGYGCPYCSGNAKLTYEDAVREFSDRGYKLLEKQYKNNKTKMKYECPKHPNKDMSITIKDLRNGHGCPYCAGLAPPTIEDVVGEFNKRGYELLEKDYINATTKMRYRCPNHPDETLYINLNKLKLGRGCRFCGIERRANLLKGKDHPNWKGGVISLNYYLRNSQVMKDWIFKSLKKHDFKCYITGYRGKELDVHHAIPFHVLRDTTLKNIGLPLKETIGDYNQEEREMILKEFERLQNECDGIPLKKEIHLEFHRECGFEADLSDLLKFKEKHESSPQPV